MWYTIPTDTEMAKADVTYDTIGFKGECASAGSTFKLYLDDEKTGAKTYHVYLKQLGGGTLTLTTGRNGATDLVLASGTYVLIIYVDENGNISSTTSSHASTSESAVTAGTASTTTTESAETETGSNEIAINIDGFTADDFVAGKTIKILVPQLDTGSPTLNINGLGAKPIKAVRAGQLVDIIAHTGYWEGAGSTSQRVWDNNTTLELIYDGTNWVVVGNPVLCSYFATDKSYSVYSNGEIEQTATIYRGSDLSAGGLWTTIVTYQIVMSDTGYTLLMSAGDKGGGGEEEREVYNTRTTSSTRLNVYNRNSSTVCQSPSMTYTVKGL
jgi:hypothetical protein